VAGAYGARGSAGDRVLTAREIERERIRDVLVVEYSYEELGIIAENMRRDLRRRREIAEMFDELAGGARYDEALLIVRSARLEHRRERRRATKAYDPRAYAKQVEQDRQRHIELRTKQPDRYAQKLAYKREWYRRNAEHAKRMERDRRKGPKGAELRARERAAHAAKRDEVNAARKRKRAADLEVERKKRREWYARHRQRELARSLKWQAEHKPQKQAYDRARHGRLKQAA
jgi:hypothetical protein